MMKSRMIFFFGQNEFKYDYFFKIAKLPRQTVYTITVGRNFI